MSEFLNWNLFFQAPRILKYRLLSNNKNVIGNPIYKQPVLLLGKGKIEFGNNVQLGYFPSPQYFNGNIHLEARTSDAIIFIGNDVYINNNFSAISQVAGIYIGDNTLIGTNCEIIDSDFHELHPEKRFSGQPGSEKVVLGKNVFLGNNVKIMKGVELGDNTVVANGAVVVGSFEANMIIGGVPAKIIGRV